MESSLLDLRNAAEYLGVSPRTVRRLVDRRILPYVKVGRCVRILRADLEAFIHCHRVDAA